MNEMILKFLRFLLGEECYHVFITTMMDLPLKKRTLYLPSEKTALADEIKHIIWMEGRAKKARDGTEEERTWADVAEELEVHHGIKLNPNDIRKRYNTIARKNKYWIEEKGYGEIFERMAIAKSCQISQILRQEKEEAEDKEKERRERGKS